MTYSLNQIPFFQELSESKNILIAGAGGGFDIYSGIPLYFNLINQGKNVTLANFAFTDMANTTSERVFPYCYKVKAGDRDLSGRFYFPEKYLAFWLMTEGLEPDIYAFERTGVNPLKKAYKYLRKIHDIDTVILVDGGTDSLMFGDEEGLGTPHEDICSMASVFRSGIKKQFLLSIGFGIDHFHGVSHYHFLENVAELAREGGYLGMFQVMAEMEEGKKFMEAVKFANEKMKITKSIVANSISSAVEGHFGDYHFTDRTAGSELFINPLMSIYWAFDLRKVVRKITYYEEIEDTNSMPELRGKLGAYRGKMTEYREKRNLPL